MRLSSMKRISAGFAIAVVLLLVGADYADARGGRGGGFGSRGSRTFDRPPATQTAPRQAQPVERSAQTQQPSVGQRALGQNAAARPGFLGSRGGFMGGLLGAGLIGMLLGYGFMGGFGGIASILGFVLQLAVIGFLLMLLFRFIQSRSQPAPAGAGASGAAPDLGGDERRGAQDLGSMFGRGGGAAAPGETGAPIEIEPGDYEEFERVLAALQRAYADGDISALRAIATPEVVGYLSEEMAEDASLGREVHMRDVKLLEGDLAEAWREGSSEYATVAMRFSAIDYTTDRESGEVVEGDPENPVEATEVWTFMRASGGKWLVSAIQQA